MTLFKSARFNLTVWYLAIATLISVCFSAIIYQEVAWEFERGFQNAERNLEIQGILNSQLRVYLDDELKLAKQILLFRLLAVNTVIVSMSGIAGYFLASKTLEPIETMLDKQKRFIGDASHELRTPLTSLRSEIEVAQRSKLLSPQITKRLLKSNLEEVNKMQNLVNYLLALSRYEDGKDKLTKKIIDLQTVAQNIVDKYQKKATKQGLKLTLIGQSIKINANATSLEELFAILIENAIKYTPKNGSIVVTLQPATGFAKIIVKDTGIGIESKDLPFIFNRFYRADTARAKSKVDGYGLGLSIAKSIVDIHAGQMTVKSTVNKGTTFIITLPK